MAACSSSSPRCVWPKAWRAPTGVRCSHPVRHQKCWWTLSMATSIAPSSSANCTTASTTCLGQPVKTAVPTTLAPSRAGICPTWTAAAPANGWWTTAKANCVCVLATHGSRGGWSELSLGHIIAQSGNGGAGHAQRGAWLGEGFYGHTDGWAIIARGSRCCLVPPPARHGCQRAKHPDGRH